MIMAFTASISIIWISILVLILKTRDADFQNINIQPCNSQVVNPNVPTTGTAGQLVETLTGNTTVLIFQQVNINPTWTYYQMTMTVDNGTLQQYPLTSTFILDFNVVSGTTTNCRRYIYVTPPTVLPQG